MHLSSYASLGLYSKTHRAADVEPVLGLTPTKMHENGDARIGKTGRTYAPFTTSVWLLDADPALNDPDDDSGFASIRVLLDRIGDRASALESLRPDYETVIWWTGDTGSVQGGFSIPSDLVIALGGLGCRFNGTLLSTDDETVEN